MSPTVLLLVVASAAIHVGWNALARSARRSASFAWLVNVSGAALLLPLLIARRFAQPFALDGTLLGLAAISALFEAGYFVLLEAAYAKGELSVVYPLSRGIAPLLALLPARAVSGDGVDARALAGIVVVVAGCVWNAGSAERRSVLLALLVGAATAAYQLVDRRAMQLAPRGAELDFLATMQIFLAALMTLWWWFGRRRTFRIERRDLRTALFAALGIQLAYFLILLALRDGSASIVAAARNVGIPLSLLAASLLLKERIAPRRVVGALLIVAGIILPLEFSG